MKNLNEIANEFPFIVRLKKKIWELHLLFLIKYLPFRYKNLLRKVKRTEV